jgi:hypothetical protein
MDGACPSRNQSYVCSSHVMAKRKKPIPLILGIVFNPEHPAVAKLLAEHGADSSRLISAAMGIVAQVPSIELVNDPASGAIKPSKQAPGGLRGTPVDHAQVILDVFIDPEVALSVSQVAEATGLSKPQARRGLCALRDTGQIFMGGDKRFAKYALTPEVANAGAVDGRTIQESVQLHRPIRPHSQVAPRIVPEEGPSV